MKPTPEERENLLGKLRGALAGHGAPTQADLARITGVNPSQICRILAGDFVTFGSAVVRICNALGVSPDAPTRPDEDDFRSGKHRSQWAKVERAVRRLWDETPDGADRLVRVLDAIAAVGERPSRSAESLDREPVRG